MIGRLKLKATSDDSTNSLVKKKKKKKTELYNKIKFIYAYYGFYAYFKY